MAEHKTNSTGTWIPKCSGEKALKGLVDIKRGTYYYQRAVFITGDRVKIAEMLGRMRAYIGEDVIHDILPNIVYKPTTRCRKADVKIAATGRYKNSQVLICNCLNKKIGKNNYPTLKWLIKNTRSHDYQKLPSELQPSGMLIITGNNLPDIKSFISNAESGYKCVWIDVGAEPKDSVIYVTDYAVHIQHEYLLPDGADGFVPRTIIETLAYKRMMEREEKRATIKKTTCPK